MGVTKPKPAFLSKDKSKTPDGKGIAGGDMKRCPSCNWRNKAGTTKCGKCGAELRKKGDGKLPAPKGDKKVQEGVFARAVKFDPGKHPRDRQGQFAALLGEVKKLSRGQGVKLPKGIGITREGTRGSGPEWRVDAGPADARATNVNGESQRWYAKPGEAAREALKALENNDTPSGSFSKRGKKTDVKESRDGASKGRVENTVPASPMVEGLLRTLNDKKATRREKANAVQSAKLVLGEAMKISFGAGCTDGDIDAYRKKLQGLKLREAGDTKNDLPARAPAAAPTPRVGLNPVPPGGGMPQRPPAGPAAAQPPKPGQKPGQPQQGGQQFEQQHPRGRGGLFIKKGDGGPGSDPQEQQKVQHLQQRLQELGYAPGAQDGTFGPMTEEAVKGFQKSQGLPESGQIDGATTSALRTPKPGTGQGTMSPDQAMVNQPAYSKDEAVRQAAEKQAIKDAENQKAAGTGHGGSGTGSSGHSAGASGGAAGRAKGNHAAAAKGGGSAATTKAAASKTSAPNAANATGVDPTDPNSIKAFQKAHSLKVDGIIGPETQAAMKDVTSQEHQKGIEKTQRDGEVRDLLKAVGIDVGSGDLKQAIKDWQKRHGLSQTGHADKTTQAKAKTVAAKRKGKIQQARSLLEAQIEECDQWMLQAADDGNREEYISARSDKARAHRVLARLESVDLDESFFGKFKEELHPRDRLGRWSEAMNGGSSLPTPRRTSPAKGDVVGYRSKQTNRLRLGTISAPPTVSKDSTVNVTDKITGEKSTVPTGAVRRVDPEINPPTIARRKAAAATSAQISAEMEKLKPGQSWTDPSGQVTIKKNRGLGYDVKKGEQEIKRLSKKKGLKAALASVGFAADLPDLETLGGSLLDLLAAWSTEYDQGKRAELNVLIEATADRLLMGIAEAKLKGKDRSSLPDSSFALPGDRRYPIHDESHARNALARASGKPEESQVKAAVYKKHPKLKKTEEAVTYDFVEPEALAEGLLDAVRGQPFDPRLHPRDREGQFINVLNQLRASGGKVRLPGGVSVQRYGDAPLPAGSKVTRKTGDSPFGVSSYQKVEPLTVLGTQMGGDAFGPQEGYKVQRADGSTGWAAQAEITPVGGTKAPPLFILNTPGDKTTKLYSDPAMAAKAALSVFDMRVGQGKVGPPKGSVVNPVDSQIAAASTGRMVRLTEATAARIAARQDGDTHRYTIALARERALRKQLEEAVA